MMAKTIHEKYRKDNKGKVSNNDPAMAPWNKLREDLKESNRHQADDLPEKLKAVGCDFTPVVDGKPELIEFTVEEIEIMAEMEHSRWNREKFMAGWSFGEKKDPAKKTHPCLVEWKDLLERDKEKDRGAVRGIPELLKSAKFEIYRLKNL